MPSAFIPLRRNDVFRNIGSFAVRPAFDKDYVNLLWAGFGAPPPFTAVSVAASLSLHYIFIGTNTSGAKFYRSLDRGCTWAAPTSVGASITAGQKIVCSDSGQYVMMSDARYCNISTDYGDTFVNTFDQGGGTHQVIAMSRSGQYVIAYRAGKGSFSTNYGASWTAVTTPGAFSGQADKIIMSDDGTYVFVTGTTASTTFLRSVDGGANFISVNYGGSTTRSLRSICCSSDGGTVYLLTIVATTLEVRLFRSFDFGATFTPITPIGDYIIKDAYPSSMFCSGDGQFVVLATSGSGAGGYRIGISNDAGHSFFYANPSFPTGQYNGQYCGAMRGDATLAILAPAVGQRLRRSPLPEYVNANWEATASAPALASLITGTPGGLRLFAGSGVSIGYPSFSTDGGDTWTLASSYPASRIPSNLSCNELGDICLAAHSTYIIRTTNGGVTCAQVLATTLGSPRPCLARTGGKAIALLRGLTTTKISSDSGATWSNGGVSPEVFSFHGVAYSDTVQKLAISSADNVNKILVSTDYGATWTAKTISGITSVSQVVFSGDGSCLYAYVLPIGETTLRQIYVSTDDGDTFSAVFVPSVDDEVTTVLCSDYSGRFLTGHRPYKGTLVTSTNYGTSWDEPATAINENAWINYDGTFAVSGANGSIHRTPISRY